MLLYVRLVNGKFITLQDSEINIVSVNQWLFSPVEGTEKLLINCYV